MGKRAIALSLIASTVVVAGTINIQQGWKLFGVGEDINVSTTLNKNSIKTVWAYNSATKKWQVYSPDLNISSQIDSKVNSGKIEKLINISKNSGFWIDGTVDANITMNDINSSNITLVSGWNLVGVGQYIVDASKFDNSNITSVWTYHYNSKNYKSYVVGSQSNTLTQINPFEGFWLNAKSNFDLNLSVTTTTPDTNPTIDITPDLFIFTPIFNTELNLSLISNDVNISGINNSGVNIGVIGQDVKYRIKNTDGNISTWRDSNATIMNGDKVELNTTSAIDFNTTRTVSLVVGDFKADWNVTTKINPNTTPQPPSNDIVNVYDGTGYGIYHINDKNGTTFNHSLKLGNNTKNVYFIITNPTETNATTEPTVSYASLEEAILKDKIAVEYAIENNEGLDDKPSIQLINSNPEYYLGITLTPKSSDVLYNATAPEVTIDENGSTRIFKDENGADVNATLMKTFTIDGKTLNIWVQDKSLDGSKATTIKQEMVETLADKFLNTSRNDIWKYVTNIYGEPWGNISYSNYIPASHKDNISILLLDIDGDNSTNGGSLGLFYSRDNFIKSSNANSNERLMFYVDSVMFATKDSNATQWDLSSKWPNKLIGTLTHEFQHMIHFYQKKTASGSSNSQTYINELCSMTTEEIVADKIGVVGPRGVATGDSGNSGNANGRLPRYNMYNYMSTSNWYSDDDVYSSYSINYAFGSYLAKNFGGAKLLGDIVHSPYTDYRAIVEAVNKNKNLNDANLTFNDILQRWGVAVMLSDKTDAPLYVRYNDGNYSTSDINGTIYNFGSTNLWNYTYSGQIGPKIFDAIPTNDSKNAGKNKTSNLYYKRASNATGDINTSITLSPEQTLTILVK